MVSTDNLAGHFLAQGSLPMASLVQRFREGTGASASRVTCWGGELPEDAAAPRCHAASPRCHTASCCGALVQRENRVCIPQAISKAWRKWRCHLPGPCALSVVLRVYPHGDGRVKCPGHLAHCPSQAIFHMSVVCRIEDLAG